MDFTRELFLGSSGTITANITAGSNIAGLSIDGASVKRIFDSLRVSGQRYGLQVRVRNQGAAPTTLSVALRLRGAPAASADEAGSVDLWATIKDTTALTAQGVQLTTDLGPILRWVQIVSAGITAAAWNGGVKIEVWLVGA